MSNGNDFTIDSKGIVKGGSTRLKKLIIEDGEPKGFDRQHLSQHYSDLSEKGIEKKNGRYTGNGHVVSQNAIVMYIFPGGFSSLGEYVHQ